MKSLLSFLFVLIVLLSSCEYEPTGANFVQIDSNFVPANTIILDPDNQNTIYVESNSTYNFKYKINTELPRFNKVVFFFDTFQIHQTYELDKSISIRVSSTDSSEMHKLTMLVLSHSGTGSLADLLGAEGTISVAEWNIEVFNPKHYKAIEPTFQVFGGSLRIDWEPYLYGNFLKYEVSKVVNNRFRILLKDISDKNHNYIIDSSYIGEKAEYQVKLYYGKSANYTDITIVDLPKLTKESEYPEVQAEILSYTSVKFKWNKSKYYNNVKGYSISNEKIIETVNIDDINVMDATSAIKSLGYRESVIFYPIPKNFELTSSLIENYYEFPTIPITIGDSSFAYTQINNGIDNWIYYINYTSGGFYSYRLTKVSTKGPSGTQSLDFKESTSNTDFFSTSPSGNNIAFRTDGKISYCLNGDLNAVEDLTPLSTHVLDFGDDLKAFSISDNGYIAMAIGSYQSNIVYIYIYNTKTREFVFFEDSGSDRTNALRISSNGEYVLTANNSIALGSKVYKIVGTSLVLVKDSFWASAVKFEPNSSKFYYVSNENNYQIKSFDCSSKVLTDISPTGYFLYGIDFVKRQILTTNKYQTDGTPTEYEIRSLDDWNNKIFSYKSSVGSGFIKENKIYFPKGLRCSY